MQCNNKIQLPLQLPLGLTRSSLNPLIIRFLPLLHTMTRNPLHNLPNKADEIRSAQGILPPPGRALPPLPLQRLDITDLRRPQSQVPRHRHNIKPSLTSGIPGNASLQHTYNPLGEHILITRAMRDRIRLQAIKLVQDATHSRVRDEMVHVCGVLVVLWWTGPFVDERRCAREGVMRCADCFAVREGFTAQVGREARREVFEGAELGADVDAVRGWRAAAVIITAAAAVGVGVGVGVVVVEDHGEDGLGSAGVLDRLGGEKGRVGVVACVVLAVLGGFRGGGVVVVACWA